VFVKPAQDQAGIDLTWSFGSCHTGGFNMAMADGSVRLISYDINETTHRRLCNRLDGLPIDGSTL
jgi:prepilin-type processing-associated H-X9-DG protein